MEQNTKNFDRAIEHMMNEHEVTPPFGMWNRISSELETMPAAAGTPVAAPLIPKRALAGIIAAALVIGGTMITGYLVNNAGHTGKPAVTPAVNSAITATVKPAVTKSNTTVQTVGVKNSVHTLTASVAKVKAKPAIASSPVQLTIQAAKQVQPTINEQVAVSTASPVIINNNTDVPTPIEPVTQSAQETQTYYFPPIDVASPVKETSSPAVTSKARTAELVPYNGDDNQTWHPKKFHPKKKQKFVYGSIIR